MTSKHAAAKRAEVSRAVQDYLKAIYKLQEAGPVQTNALAEHLGVVAPSATNMIGRLAEAGFLRHTPYRGVELSDDGAAIALEVIRHHRLWELFLHRALGLLPGATVELRAREPFSGPLTVRVGESDRVIGHELASQLRVEPAAS